MAYSTNKAWERRVREEQFRAYINEAKSPEERQRRKQAAYRESYSSGPQPFSDFWRASNATAGANADPNFVKIEDLIKEMDEAMLRASKNKQRYEEAARERARQQVVQLKGRSNAALGQIALVRLPDGTHIDPELLNGATSNSPHPEHYWNHR